MRAETREAAIVIDIAELDRHLTFVQREGAYLESRPETSPTSAAISR